MPVSGPRPIYQGCEAGGMAAGPLTFHLFPLSFRMRPCPWISSLPLFIFRHSVNVKQRAREIIQRQWTRGTVTNLCHWHCDLCRQFVTHEPGDLCDITEKNTTGDRRRAAEALGDSAPQSAGVWSPRDVPFPQEHRGRGRWEDRARTSY